MTEHKERVRARTWMAVLAGTVLAGSGAMAEPVEVVKIAGGQVRGVATDVAGVQVFKGLPYAGPTGGEARFAPPGPVVPWEGVKLADSWGDQVMQDANLNPPGGFWGDEFYWDAAFMPKASENGLNLNVFTPAKDSGDKLPVYVWIHGGGNDHGYASEMEFWASKLAAKGVIVVPVQYRVGPWGFMALPGLDQESDDGVSGNQALKDLIASLHWVQDNIAGFGGDPANVTIGGQSAGSTNTITLLRSPAAKGLFHRAVIESNQTSFLPIKLPTLAEQEAKNEKALQDIFGKPMNVADLRAIPAADFLTTKIGDRNLMTALNATVKTYVIDGQTLTQEGLDLLKPGALDGIDVLIGNNSDEATSLYGTPDGTMSEADFAAAMTKLYGDGWKDVYMPSDPTNAYRLYLRTTADYRHAAVVVSSQMVKDRNPGSNIFAYYFNMHLPGRDDEFYGSFHSSELWYMFNSMRDVPGQRHWTGMDKRMAETMSTYLANFIRSGDPNGDGLPQWPQPAGKPAFMRFADGYAYAVDGTPYPERDALNRQAILTAYGLSAGDL